MTKKTIRIIAGSMTTSAMALLLTAAPALAQTPAIQAPTSSIIKDAPQNPNQTAGDDNRPVRESPFDELEQNKFDAGNGGGPAGSHQHDIFSNAATDNTDTSSNLPSTDEYKTVGTGLLMDNYQPGLAGTGGAADTGNAGKPADTASADNKSPKTHLMSIDDIMSAYQKGKYAEVLPALQPLAQHGDAGAAELLGIMYHLGQGTGVNDVQAVKWLTQAADAGRPLAEHYLGTLYYLGKGTDQNNVQAMKWLILAALHYQDGAEKDRALSDIKNVQARMLRRDEDRAKDLARNWLHNHGEERLIPKIP